MLSRRARTQQSPPAMCPRQRSRPWRTCWETAPAVLLRQRSAVPQCCWQTSLRAQKTPVLLSAAHSIPPPSLQRPSWLADWHVHSTRDGTSSERRSITLGLLDCAGAWGSLLEPDLVTMVEVIEHMEPHILE